MWQIQGPILFHLSSAILRAKPIEGPNVWQAWITSDNLSGKGNDHEMAKQEGEIFGHPLAIFGGAEIRQKQRRIAQNEAKHEPFARWILRKETTFKWVLAGVKPWLPGVKIHNVRSLGASQDACFMWGSTPHFIVFFFLKKISSVAIVNGKKVGVIGQRLHCYFHTIFHINSLHKFYFFQYFHFNSNLNRS